MTLFENLHPSVQELLLTGLGWENLRAVQEETYRAVSAGTDVIVIAPTAGGKTESAFLPVIDFLLKNPPKKTSVRAVYISPLKALINDQTDRVLQMCTRAGLTVAVQHGDVASRDRWKFTKEDEELPDILLTTPESLEVLLSDARTYRIFEGLSFVIIDEIHAFVDSDRGVHLKCLLDRLDKVSKNHIVRLGLSATVGNPEFLLNWLSSPQRKKQLVKIPSPPSKKQFSFVVESDFYKQTDEIIKRVRGKKVLLFTDSRSFAEKLIAPLKEGLPSVYIHHSSVSSEDREEAELSFERDTGSCVICTSTMELGIDIGELDMVVQYGAPRSVASFLQRLGRTGRRGKSASMCFILNNCCELLTTVSVIEAAMRHESENLAPPCCPYHVLIQQLFLLMKKNMGLGISGIVNYLKSLSAFSEIPPSAYSQILEHLVDNNYLTRSGDMYVIGERAERELGRSNWLSLISVIHDSGGYLAVLPDGTPVGTLDPRFVGGEPGKTFSFTGKSWRLIHRDDVHKRALVEPAGAKSDLKRPFWTGDGGSSGASALVCQSVLKTISKGISLPLPDKQKEELDDIIRMLPENFEVGKIHIRCEPESKGWSVVVSTFLGQRANMVIARLIKNRIPKKHTLRYTQFAIRIFDFDEKNAGDVVAEILKTISQMSVEEVMDELPKIPADNWKFGALLPEELILEMTAKDYY
ncbi:MAG: DEAD/DEAH box helicase, partial [Methanocorpusculum sp.]|nr:DEAD/DEAH box helicase [Methanocorpusculum sp.]